MSPDQIIAIAAGVGVPTLLVGGGALWKLASQLSALNTIVTRELTHNGGSSIKDYARAGRDQATAAKEQAALAKHLAESVDTKVDQLTTRQAAIEKRLRQVSDAVVGMQAVQTYRDASAPGSTTVSHTTTTSSTTNDGTSP